MTEKSFIGMLHVVCPICLKESEQGSIVIHKRMRPVFEKDNYQIGPLCDHCKQLNDQGYIAFVGAKNKTTKPITPEEADRTGVIVHLKRDVCERLFGQVPTTPFVWMDEALQEEFKKLSEHLESEQE